MKASYATLLLDAGALLPLKQKIEKDQIADEISAPLHVVEAVRDANARRRSDVGPAIS